MTARVISYYTLQTWASGHLKFDGWQGTTLFILLWTILRTDATSIDRGSISSSSADWWRQTLNIRCVVLLLFVIMLLCFVVEPHADHLLSQSGLGSVSSGLGFLVIRGALHCIWPVFLAGVCHLRLLSMADSLHWALTSAQPGCSQAACNVLLPVVSPRFDLPFDSALASKDAILVEQNGSGW